MAIFANDNQHTNAPVKGGPATIIAQGTQIKGEIHTSCHLHIDGEFEGNIHSKSVVMIGKNGVVRGSIYAQKLIVSGKLEGNTHSSVVEILPMGRIEGRVVTPEFVIERKGIFLGESKSAADKEQSKEKQQVD